MNAHLQTSKDYIKQHVTETIALTSASKAVSLHIFIIMQKKKEIASEHRPGPGCTCSEQGSPAHNPQLHVYICLLCSTSVWKAAEINELIKHIFINICHQYMAININCYLSILHEIGSLTHTF